MFYIIDFTERTKKWAQLSEKPCLVAAEFPEAQQFTPADIVFAHYTDFRPDLDDRAYEADKDIQSEIKRHFAWNEVLAKEGLQRILRFRVALREALATLTTKPWFVIYSGDANQLNTRRIIINIKTRSLAGFGEERIYVHPFDLNRSISLAELRSVLAGIVHELSTLSCKGTTQTNMEPLDRLPALALLCQGYTLALDTNSKLVLVNKDKLRKNVQCPEWWRKTFREFTGARQLAAALESEWGGQLPKEVETLLVAIFGDQPIQNAVVKQAVPEVAKRLGY